MPASSGGNSATAGVSQSEYHVMEITPPEGWFQVVQFTFYLKEDRFFLTTGCFGGLNLWVFFSFLKNFPFIEA